MEITTEHFKAAAKLRSSRLTINRRLVVGLVVIQRLVGVVERLAVVAMIVGLVVIDVVGRLATMMSPLQGVPVCQVLFETNNVSEIIAKPLGDHNSASATISRDQSVILTRVRRPEKGIERAPGFPSKTYIVSVPWNSKSTMAQKPLTIL